MIDWINTINEPNCLLLSSIDELRDGRVLIEIGKHLLKQRGYFTLINKMGNIDWITPKDRFILLFKIIEKIDNEKNISLFKSNVNIIGRVDELLIDLVGVLKNLSNHQYDSKQIKESELNEIYQQSGNSNSNNRNCISIEDNIFGSVNDNDNDDNNEAEQCNDTQSKEEIHNFELSDKGDMTIETEERNQLNCFYYQLRIEANDAFSYYRKDKKKTKGNINTNTNTNNSKANNTLIKERKALSVIPIKSPFNNTHNKQIKPNVINNSINTIRPTKLLSFSLSPMKKTTYSNDINKPNMKHKQICQRDLTSIFGTYSAQKIKCDNTYLLYYIFQKPTELIIEANSYQLIKKNMFNQKPNKDNFDERDFFIIVNNAKRNEYSIPKKKKSIESNVVVNYSLSSPRKETDSTKTRIYLWLIDIGMIKFNAIDIYDVPSLCINGIFLCDLINKCEGRFETIHGINRVIRKETQIKANIRKVLEHLRKKDAFASRHLWSSDSIRNGDSKVIWEFLEDIWLFYPNKVQKAKSFRNIFIKEPIVNRNNSQSQPKGIGDIVLQTDKKTKLNYNNNQHLGNHRQYHQKNQSSNFRNEFIKQCCQSPVNKSKTKIADKPTIQIFNHFSYNSNRNNNNTFTTRTNKTNENRVTKRNNTTNNPYHISHNKESKPIKRNYILFEKLSLRNLKKELEEY